MGSLIVAAGVYAWRADHVAAPGHQRAQRLRPGAAGHHPRHHRPGRSLAGHAGVRQSSPSAMTSSPRRRGCRSATSTTSSSTATAPTGPSRSASASTTTSTPRCASGGFQVDPRSSRQLPRHRLQPGFDAEHGHARRPDRDDRARVVRPHPRPRQAGRPRGGALPACQRLSLLPPGRLVRADQQQPHRRRGASAGARPPSSSRSCATPACCRCWSGWSAAPRRRTTTSATAIARRRCSPSGSCPASPTRPGASSCSPTSCCRTRPTASMPTARSC